ncbi:nucleoid-associated protein [Thiohalomonas denitrificans]|uniref:Nucleoid-associated protein n=1 Tax=Thiohalomonas denitrificans TaxID=415747 RepID=A0A1G5QMS5_9GAMM|nr:nucleoid-associated protein [Thiohalomonas denitrificans]SCZ63032.1 nucleoid-associated protein [Thiohalomonas denitrificans]
MSITHATVHRIRRSTDSEAEMSLRQQELATEESCEALLDSLKSAFLGRISREHGSFSTEEESAPLPRQLTDFVNEERAFGELTATLMEDLRRHLDSGKVELNAHCLFFVEKTPVRHLFYWFVASQKEALSIGDDLEVTPSYSLDTGPSLFGIKVDLAEWKVRQHYSYLTLLPPRGNPGLTDAFHALTGFANGLDKAGATLAFLEGVEAYSEKLPEEQVGEYRNQVVEYCLERDQQDAPVDLKELAQTLDGVDHDEFVQVVERRAPEGEQELMMDRRSLRRYVKFAGREKDLAISFGSYQLNQRVHYDSDTDTLSINGLPSALRKQLLEHLRRD